jgi:[CysO sulfur-carrier protein]-S-L-cysteine hydrolase
VGALVGSKVNMKMPRKLYDEMVAHAREEAPNECCGMVGASESEAVAVYRARNAEASPLRFRIDPEEQLELHNRIEDAGLELGAIYHSHTRTEPRPSQTDINFAKLWPGVLWIIVGLVEGEPDVRTWWIDDGRVTGAELVVE